jgi:hypothetical protein
MKKPNFFIVGAPKCATTALFEYIKTHPNVFMSRPYKEPCFFCPEFPTRRLVDSLDEYIQLFDDANETHRIVGEASVWYLYSKVAIKNVYEFNPDSKLIVMLRNPVEQVYSMHMQCYILDYETETDFIKAWRLQEDRKNGKNLPTICKEEKLLQYKDIASYSSQIERLLSIFPRDQVKFILFDDFKSNTRQVYCEVLDFLELEEDDRQEFQVENAGQRYKFQWLGDFLLEQPRWLVSLKSWVKRTFKISHLTMISSFINKFNVEVGKREQLSAEFVDELKEEFREDVSRVSALIDKDLSHWCD